MQGPTRNGSRAGYRWRNNPASKSPERFIQLSKRLIARILAVGELFVRLLRRAAEQLQGRAPIQASSYGTEYIYLPCWSRVLPVAERPPGATGIRCCGVVWMRVRS